MGLFNDLPTLTTSLLTKLWGTVCKLFFLLPGVMIHGPLLIHVDERLQVDLKRPYHRDYPEPGLFVDEQWIPLDESATQSYTLYGTEVWLAFGEIQSFLRPSSLEANEDEIQTTLDERDVDEAGALADGFGLTADGGVNATADAIARVMAEAPGDPGTLRQTLAKPFLAGYFMMAGAFCVLLDDNGRMEFVKAQTTDEPARGMIVDDEFKKAESPGVYYERWGGTMAVSARGWESLFNLATAEVLRSKDDLEQQTGRAVGTGTEDVDVTVLHRTATFAHDRLADYAPFDLFDGNQTRRQVQTAHEAHSKKNQQSNLLMYGGMVIAFFLGALSPRLNGTSGGGGGGGGGPVLPTPSLTPPPELVGQAADLAGTLVATGVV